MKTLTIISRTIKSRYRNWLMYSLIGLAFLLMYIPMYPWVRDQSAAYEQILKSIPAGLMQVFNIQGFGDSLLYWLNTEHFSIIWPLLLILLTVSFGGSAIAKEIESRTLAVAFSQPVSRSSWYLAKLGAGKVGLLLFVVLSMLSVAPLAAIFGYTVDGGQVVYIAIAGYLFGLAMLSLSLMVSSAVSSGGLATGITSLVLFLMYGVYIVASFNKDLENLKYGSLFYYFNPAHIIKTGQLNSESVIAFLAFSVATTLVGLIIFNRRELKI